jgi:hypothetical protein
MAYLDNIDFTVQEREFEEYFGDRYSDSSIAPIISRAEPSRAEPSRAEPSRAKRT